MLCCVLQATELQALQERLDSQQALAKQAEDNARAAERKAAEQATIAAAARAEVCPKMLAPSLKSLGAAAACSVVGHAPHTTPTCSKVGWAAMLWFMR